MNRPNEQPERFDPTAAIGRSDELPIVPPVDELAGADDAKLLDLLRRATQPPADLKLDWGRLRSNLARESQAGSGQASVPLSDRLTGRGRRFYLGGSLAAAAAMIVLTTVLVMWQSAPSRPGNPVVGVPIASPPAHPVQPQAIVWVGVEESDARDLVNDKTAATRNELVVVFPRADAAPSAPPAAAAAGPMVITGKNPLGGSPYGRVAPDSETDSEYPGF